MNSKTKGLVGIGAAIKYYTSIGVNVSIPLNDSQSYDLVIDRNGLKRVQVKTTYSKSKHGSWNVPLRTTGGNQSFHTAKQFDKNSCDVLFVLAGDGNRWEIPTSEITKLNCLSVGNKSYNEYKIGLDNVL